MQPTAEDIEKAKNIRAAVFDVDGTFTNGCIGYGTGSGDEIKFFSCRDGMGIGMLRRSGIIIGVITGRECKANLSRLRGDLRIEYIYQGKNVKQRQFEQFCFEAGVSPKECLYMGDDFNDLIPMKMAGIAACTGDAEPEIKEFCDWVAERPGGGGAIRDIVNRLLKAKGLFEKAIAIFTEFDTKGKE